MGMVTGAAVALVLLAIVGAVVVDRRRLQREVAAAVKQSDEDAQRFRSAFDDAPIGVALIGPDHRILAVNRALRGMLGINVGDPLEVAILPEDTAASSALMSRLLSGAADRVEIDTRLARHDGTILHARITAAGVADTSGDVVSVITHVVDRTERHAALLHLREAEARFRNAFAHASTGMAIVAPDGQYLQVNPSLCRILGRREEELLGLRFIDIRHPDDRLASDGVRQRLLRGDHDAELVELRIVRPDGDIVWGRTSVTVVRDAAGEALYFVSLTEDITAERTAEEALRRRQRRFEALVEHSSDIIGMFDANAQAVWTSPSATRVLGFPHDYPIASRMGELVHPEDRSRVREVFFAVVQDPGGTSSQPFELRMQTVDGSYRHFETIATNLLHDPDVEAVVTNSRDIT